MSTRQERMRAAKDKSKKDVRVARDVSDTLVTFLIGFVAVVDAWHIVMTWL